MLFATAGQAVAQTAPAYPPRTTEIPPRLVDPALAEELPTADRIAIHELIHRTYLAEDSRNHDALRHLFAERHVTDHAFGRFESAEAFIRWTEANTAGFDGIRHQAFNIVTRRISDTEAEAFHYYISMRVYDASARGSDGGIVPYVLGHGAVRDRLVKEGGRWRIAERVYDQIAVAPPFMPDRAGRQRFSKTADQRNAK
jgi:hypothetical protein